MAKKGVCWFILIGYIVTTLFIYIYNIQNR